MVIENKLTGAIALGDIIREESKEAIKQLKEMGIKTMMLTGDNKQVAKWVADELGLDDYFAEVFRVKKRKSKGSSGPRNDCGNDRRWRK